MGSMSRIPTFRRRFRNLVKIVYLEAMQEGVLASHDAGTLRLWQDKKHHRGRGRKKENGNYPIDINNNNISSNV